MKILILQGPNLNLIGVRSAKSGTRVTLDKINKGIRRFIRNKDIEIKIYQTHRIDKVITILQRNRNWADGIIIAPGVWSTYEAIVVDTLELVAVPCIEVYDEEDNPDYAKKSLLSTVCREKIIAPSQEMFIAAISAFIK